MVKGVKGIITYWRYRKYRSRLEARWACMFDLLGWKYEYEPYDLNGWIPDFILVGDTEILVDVKPYTTLKEFEECELDKIMKAIKGTEKYGKEILLLGCTIFEKAECWASAPALGWLGEFGRTFGEGVRFGYSYSFGYAVFNHNKYWGFFHDSMWYKDRITGLYDGDNHIIIPTYEEVLELWNKAGNQTQWKKP
ncbi:MAG: hypothetical protein J7K37_01075 [Candidatus Omnitrophica bacterium]|nr:hypothetical protein [Candidatus Omnitrophota bacterium]